MPLTPRDWSAPFLEQARADLRVAEVLPAELRGSTFCMLLQMVFEKLAKAAYAGAGNDITNTHRTASRLFVTLERDPDGRNLLRASPDVRAFVEQLEVAHPQFAKTAKGTPQLEYPWSDHTETQVHYLERDLPLARRTRHPRDRIAADCLKLASALEKLIARMSE